VLLVLVRLVMVLLTQVVVAVAQQAVRLVLAALASSSFVTLQHKALPHHLVAQTHPKFHTQMATKFTLGHHLEL
jgi:disulfide bond formation protein DsbB